MNQGSQQVWGVNRHKIQTQVMINNIAHQTLIITQHITKVVNQSWAYILLFKI